MSGHRFIIIIISWFLLSWLLLGVFLLYLRGGESLIVCITYPLDEPSPGMHAQYIGVYMYILSYTLQEYPAQEMDASRNMSA